MGNIDDFKSWIIFLIIVIIAVVSNIYASHNHKSKKDD